MCAHIGDPGKRIQTSLRPTPMAVLSSSLSQASVSGKKLPRQMFVFLTPSTVTASAVE